MAKKIMVVDDDPDLREATEIVLSGAGYDVSLAASAAEALEMIKTTPVDLFILDVMMETDTEGFHLAYKIRDMDKHKNTPIVMLTCIEERTGQVLDPDKAGDFLPVQGFLRKPMDAKTLKAKVAELLK
jgi:DNA-binding response OmpR family regulator